MSFQGLSEDADRDGWVTKLQGKSIPGQQARVSAETANCFKTILDTFRHNQDIQLSFGNSRNRKPSRQAIVTIHTSRMCLFSLYVYGCELFINFVKTVAVEYQFCKRCILRVLSKKICCKIVMAFLRKKLIFDS